MATIQGMKVTALPSLSEAKAFIKGAQGQHLAVDTETTGLLMRDGRDHMQGLSICYKEGSRYYGFYFPFRHQFGENYPKELLFELRDLIESAPTLTFHNAKFDIVVLSTVGIKVKTGQWICTMMMAHLINENFPRSKSLDNCAKAYLPEGVSKTMPEEMRSIVDAKGLGWSYVSSELMFEYARQDPIVTYVLREKLWPLFQKENLDDYWPHKARLIEVVIEMERRGIEVNQEFCAKMVDSAEQAIQDYMEMLGGKNPGSPKDMKELLLDELGLPVVKRSAKTGNPSFDKEAMGVYEQILATNPKPLAEYIMGYRGWVKAKSSFYEAYLRLVSPDGRLRPNYKHHKDEDEGGTVTGRLSCSDPNLQQIPRTTDKAWNGRVKNSFKGMTGYSLWEADYAQLELRLGTAYANEPTLKQLFREGRDVFTEMAARMGWLRYRLKTFVYSVQYGAGKTRVSHVFECSESQAMQYINDYYDAYPNFRKVSAAAAAKVLSTRRIRLWSGRYRHFAFPKEESHKAFNSLIQGGAADIVERIMIALYEEVDQKSNGEVRMLLQVHDSVIFEIKNGTEEKWGPIITNLMSDVNRICTNFDVVFDVDFHKFGD